MAKKSKKKEFITVVVPTGVPYSAGEESAKLPGGGGVELHAGLLGFGTQAEEIDWDVFQKNWVKTRDQVAAMMKDFSAQTFGKMELAELQVGLSATGKGSIGIASVSAAANILLKFRKK